MACVCQDGIQGPPGSPRSPQGLCHHLPTCPCPFSTGIDPRADGCAGMCQDGCSARSSHVWGQHRAFRALWTCCFSHLPARASPSFGPLPTTPRAGRDPRAPPSSGHPQCQRSGAEPTSESAGLAPAGPLCLPLCPTALLPTDPGARRRLRQHRELSRFPS